MAKGAHGEEGGGGREEERGGRRGGQAGNDGNETPTPPKSTHKVFHQPKSLVLV